MSKCKFKVGDRVIGNEKATEEYGVTKEGWIGIVTEVGKVVDGQFRAKGDNDITYTLSDKYFDLYNDAITVGCHFNGKVRCVGYNRDGKLFTLNKVYDVVNGHITNDNGYCYREINENSVFSFLKSWYDFVVVSEDSKDSTEKIVITHDGKITTATWYYDGQEMTATAKCSPKDTFDFPVGAKLALERLVGKRDAEQWRVVNRPAKVGDYIRLKSNANFSFVETGDILRVDRCVRSDVVQVYGRNHSRDTGFPNHLWTYRAAEYEVVEKATKPEKLVITPNTEYSLKAYDEVQHHIGLNKSTWDKICKSPVVPIANVDCDCDCDYKCQTCAGTFYINQEAFKGEWKDHPTYYNGNVVCVESPYSWWTVGKVYEVKDGVIVADDGIKYPRAPIGKPQPTPYKDAADIKHAGCGDDGGRHNPRNTFIPLVE